MTLQIFINMIKEWVIAQAYATEAWVLGKNYTTMAEVKAYSAKARRYRSTNQPIATNTWTKVQLNAESYDTQNRFSNYKFTAAHGGHYQVNVALLLDNSGANKIFISAIYKNGTVYAKCRLHSAFNSYMSSCVSDVIRLEAGDYVEAWCYHDVGGNRNVTGSESYSFMSVGELI